MPHRVSLPRHSMMIRGIAPISPITLGYGAAIKSPRHFPDAVAITGNGKICTGVVIGPQAVLTAAHCYCGGVTQTVYFGDTILHATTTVGVSGGKAMIQCGPNMQLQGVDVAVLRRMHCLPSPPVLLLQLR